MIRVTCSSCGKSFNVKDEKRGKALACKCGARIDVPEEGAGDAGSDDDEPEAVEDEPEDAGGEDEKPARPVKKGLRSGPRASAGKAAASAAAEAAATAGAKAARDALGAAKAAIPKGTFKAIAPPDAGPAVRLLWLGLALLVVSFGLKQVLVSWSVASVSEALEAPRLLAKQAAVMHDLDAEIEEIELEIRYMELPEDADSDQRKDFRERREKLEKEMEELRKKQKSDRLDIAKDYAEDLLEAEGDMKHATAFGLRKAQWTLTLKFFLDLAKIAGAVLVIFSSLAIAADPAYEGALKAYAAVCGGVALLSIVLGGFLTLLG